MLAFCALWLLTSQPSLYARGSFVADAFSSDASGVNAGPSHELSHLLLEKKGECDPDAAFNQALTVRADTKYHDFVEFIRHFDLVDDLKNLTRGRALYLPDSLTLDRKFKSMGLLRNYGTYDFKKYRMGPYRRAKFMDWVRVRLVRSRRAFEKKVGSMVGLKLGKCQYVEGVSLRIDENKKSNTIVVDRPTNCSMPHFGAFMGSARETSIGFDGITEFIGKGYNILTGNPLSLRGDPGFAHSPFSIEDETAYSYRSEGGQCITETDSSVSSSSRGVQEKAANSIGVSGEYSKVSFTGNVQWGSTFESKDASRAATIIGTTDVNVASADLAPLESLKLCSAFKTAVQSAIDNKFTDDTLQNILDNYGTHYLHKVVLGGKASNIIQTSAQTLERLQSSNVNVAASVSASYGLFSGKADVSSASEEKQTVYNELKSSYKETIQRPGGVNVPVNEKSGEVDCGSYFNQLSAQPSLPAVSYQIRPITKLLKPSVGGLWTEAIAAGDVTLEDIQSLAQALQKYILECKGCRKPEPTCNAGFYGDAPNCQSCYGGSGPVGSKGNCHPSQTCNPSDGQCQGEIPSPPPQRYIIRQGEYLNKGESLRKGSCELRFQESDGNIVMMRDDRLGCGRPNCPESLAIGNDGGTRLGISDRGYGNLVVTGANGDVVWASKTLLYKNGEKAPAGAQFIAELQEDCNFVIYWENRGEGVREAQWSWWGDDSYSQQNGNNCYTNCNSL